MKISIVGGGYAGLVTGACLANLGHQITIIDKDKDKVQIINDKHSPIYEPGLENLLQQHIGIKFRATIEFNSIASADIVFICVGTPSKFNGSTDLSHIKSASFSIGTALKNNCCIIVKSTVPPGTTEKIVRPIVLMISGKSENEIKFAMNPEFLREGQAIKDFMCPDRIIIGTNNLYTKNQISEIYREIHAPILYTSIPAAEMIKYASNAFLATKISFSNEIGNICKHLNINTYEVMKGIGLDQRIGPQFLNAGVGFGGSCFKKDLSALILLAQKTKETPVLLQAVIDINEKQPYRIITLLENKIGNLSGKQITILGLAFKDNTDDIRNSQTIPVISELLQKGAYISVYDPKAMKNMQQLFPDIKYCYNAADALTDADGCLIMTEWEEFSQLEREFDMMKNKIIIEGRKILSCKGVDGICW